MVPTTYLPHPRLSEYIASYGFLELCEGRREPYFSPPLALCGMIIQVINQHNIAIAKINGGDFITCDEVATGQVTYSVYGELIGHIKSILIFINPIGLYQLFGNNMALLTNKSMPLRQFLGQTIADGLIRKLKADQNDEAQVKVLNDFFLGQKPIVKGTEKIREVLDYIHARSGGVSVKEIEQNCHCQRKTLERQFQKMVGLSPKVYIQIYQFKCLINLLQEYPAMTWSQLCDRAGYFDQSHMSRYFKEYLKVSPNNIVNLDVEFINYLLRVDQ